MLPFYSGARVQKEGNMNTQDILAVAGLVAAGLLAAAKIFQVKKIARALTAELSEKMEAAQKSQDEKWSEVKQYQEETRCLLDKHIRMDDERNADLLRSRILRFNNELVRSIDHTQEDFDEILGIIDAYRTYCRTHEEYKNNKCTHAIANIERCYDDRLEKHDFL